MTDTPPEYKEQNDTKPRDANSEIEDLQQEIVTLKAELHEKNDKYLMALAESENARKRMQKERQELMQYAIENVLLDFLNPIESMEKALGFATQMSDDVKNWVTGFIMILNQFKQIFEEKGIIEYSSVGQKFNPFLHEAVETEETLEVPEGTVLEEFTKGYKIGERPLRVARVKVAKTPTYSEENKE
ncbi:nucleotide exchange factor GrpE [Candidatus Chlamydia sanziniae]|uniref:Protein GrpE n=1 Tax=Candidatus Chlamydia sanziniae TaxID=1806891 RepID=A0A1A9HW72_9CHLA|nr:nucleotide exchange factor GrpE [Candidatus Chlamydia sanziniae]ANH78294.1 Heat shock protein GrpE [Candidatus Chlamydia sanziniae]